MSQPLRLLSLLVVLLSLSVAYGNYLSDLKNLHKDLLPAEHEAARKRQSNTCQSIVCKPVGSPCVPIAAYSNTTLCQPCLDTFQNCSVQAGADACSCVVGLMDCFRALDSTIPCRGVLLPSLHPQCLNTCPDNRDTECGAAPPGVTFDICQFDGFCDSAPSGYTGVCTASLPFGSTCNPDNSGFFGAQCGETLFDQGECDDELATPTCVRSTPYANVGDGCVVNEDCRGDATTCVNLVCVGLNVGQACSSTQECAYGLYCDDTSSTCTSKKPKGQPCSREINGGDNSNDECQSFLICNAAGVCADSFTLDVGQDCVDFGECKAGLVCNHLTGKCATTGYVPVPCNLENPNCPTGAGSNTTCQCNFYTGQPECATQDVNLVVALDQNCVDRFEAMVECAEANQCTELSLVPDSCTMTKCAEQTNCLYNCYLPVVETVFGGNCAKFTVPGCDASSAIHVVPAVILASMSLMALML